MKKQFGRLAVLLVLAFFLLGAVVTTTQASSIREIFQNLGFNASDVPTDEAPADDDMSGSSGELEFKGVVESISGDWWTVDGNLLLVDLNTVLEGSPTVGSYVEVKAFLQADGSWLAARIHTEDMNSSTDDSHDDDMDDDMDDDDAEVEFYGTVESINGSLWTINGQSVTVDSSTMLDAAIMVGSFVEVKAFVQTDGSLLAARIHLEDDSEGSSSGDDDSDGSSDDDSPDDDYDDDDSDDDMDEDEDEDDSSDPGDDEDSDYDD